MSLNKIQFLSCFQLITGNQVVNCLFTHGSLVFKSQRVLPWLHLIVHKVYPFAIRYVHPFAFFHLFVPHHSLLTMFIRFLSSYGFTRLSSSHKFIHFASSNRLIRSSLRVFIDLSFAMFSRLVTRLIRLFPTKVTF